MPIYEYECPEHGRFELLEKISDNPQGKPINCESAGCRKKAKRVISASAFHLKGSGWYKTDYSSKPSSSNGASVASKGSGDSGDSAAKSGESTESKKSDSSSHKCGTSCAC